METSKISLLNANTLELHYWFNDQTHTMDAFVQNKCERELLAIIEEKEYRDHDEMNGVYDDLIEMAADLAKEFHREQVDKQGVDYFQGHLSTVGNAGDNWKEKIVGFLHDAAEDTPHTIDEIVRTLKNKSKGVLKDGDAQEISEALNLLNSNTASSREEYIARIKESFIATKVKLNDLRHNIDISRISNPTDKDMERTKRYRKEYRQILEYLGPVAWE